MRDSLRLTKHHGLGNDFLISLSPTRPIDDDDVRHLCDRHRGFGADGLIVADQTAPGTDERPGSAGWWTMILRNADGSRAEISGNGIRCLGQAIARSRGLDRGKEHRLVIDTDAGQRTLDLQRSAGEPDEELQVRVAMGAIADGPSLSDDWTRHGVAVKAQASADVGNPHLIGFVNAIEGIDMAVVGPAIEADYADGCNVHVAEVVSPTRLLLKIWERGAGITEACGSGACAAAWSAKRLGFVDSEVEVVMPGGSVRVELLGDEAFLTGPSVYVGEVLVG